MDLDTTGWTSVAILIELANLSHTITQTVLDGLINNKDGWWQPIFPSCKADKVLRSQEAIQGDSNGIKEGSVSKNTVKNLPLVQPTGETHSCTGYVHFLHGLSCGCCQILEVSKTNYLSCEKDLPRGEPKQSTTRSEKVDKKSGRASFLSPSIPRQCGSLSLSDSTASIHPIVHPFRNLDTVKMCRFSIKGMYERDTKTTMAWGDLCLGSFAFPIQSWRTIEATDHFMR